MILATERQENFICEIALLLGVPEPMHLSKVEASKWIGDHVDEYQERVEAVRENAGYFPFY